MQNSELLNKNQYSNKAPSHPMLLDNYDPNSVKLFSKCARNQASKFTTQKRPHSTGKLYSSLITYNESEKKKKVVCTFDMYESRQQRQKKSKPTTTPAVGQYNPKMERKIKLTWDILKIYNNPTKNRKEKMRTSVSASQQLKVEQQGENNVAGQILEQSLNTNIMDSYKPEKIYADENDINKSNQPHQNTRYIPHKYSKKVKYDNNRYKTIKSQVDMSRMTGRLDSKQNTYADDDKDQNSQLDATKSIEYIKSKPSINLQFDRQISREKIQSMNKPSIVPTDYSYDYSILKPRAPKVVSYDKSANRSNYSDKKNNQVYSYTHYDYDKYVWQGKSSIYSNTKTYVADFKKQTNRVIFKR